MSSTGRINKGVVTQDDATLDGGNDNLGCLTNTDPEIRACMINAMMRADVVLCVNGRGTQAEDCAAHRHRLEEDDLNREMEEEEEEEGGGGRDVHEGVVAERDEVEDERGGGEDTSAARGLYLPDKLPIHLMLMCNAQKTRPPPR
jgi:hypothetical protein